MSAYGYALPVPEKSNTRLDWILEGLLIALLAFMPLTFGAVHAWSEQIVVTLAAAIAVVFGVRMVL
ncbi:MAG: hypothetical protein ABFE01_29030, partial [Phycisphaerales bacterium]